MRLIPSFGWSGSPATSVGLSEALAVILWAYKVSAILLSLRGICDPGPALSVEVDICFFGVVVLEAMLDFTLDDVGDAWLISRDAFLLGFNFFPVEEDDILCKLFRFHSGVHITLLASGVLLEFGGVLFVLGGVLCGGVRLPCTSALTSL